MRMKEGVLMLAKPQEAAVHGCSSAWNLMYENGGNHERDTLAWQAHTVVCMGQYTVKSGTATVIVYMLRRVIR